MFDICGNKKQLKTIKNKNKMNPNDVLDNLSQGFVSKSCPAPIDPAVLSALAASATTQKQVTQIATPVSAKTIDLSSLASGVENEPEFTFTNNTGVTITYWFTGLFNNPGDASDFGIAGNSAFDYPAAQGSGNHIENGGSDLRVFNKKVIAVGGFVVSRVQVVTSNTGTQKNQRLVMNTNNVANDPCNGRLLAPLCDACNNNNNSDTFTANFNGPIGVGGNSSFGYPVLNGESVTVRVSAIGQAIYQYTALGNGNC